MRSYTIYALTLLVTAGTTLSAPLESLSVFGRDISDVTQASPLASTSTTHSTTKTETYHHIRDYVAVPIRPNSDDTPGPGNASEPGNTPSTSQSGHKPEPEPEPTPRASSEPTAILAPAVSPAPAASPATTASSKWAFWRKKPATGTDPAKTIDTLAEKAATIPNPRKKIARCYSECYISWLCGFLAMGVSGVTGALLGVLNITAVRKRDKSFEGVTEYLPSHTQYGIPSRADAEDLIEPSVDGNNFLPSLLAETHKDVASTLGDDSLIDSLD
ncbi:hypothetical protein BC835DRAFT_1517281 [Cytidiella melzeri]|nr:hypothetical protein BC835DRAFT_1517281 [Cytidiella melzeri]